jgi:hypothetical protein
MRKLCVVPLLLVAMLLAGCDFVDDSTTSLDVAYTAYETTIKAATHAEISGQITPEQLATVVAAGKVFYGAWDAASLALQEYAAALQQAEASGLAKPDRQIVVSALASAAGKLDELKAAWDQIKDGSTALQGKGVSK